MSDIADTKPPIQLAASFAGGSFSLNAGRPGFVAHEHSQVPPHDQPFEVALPSLLQAMPVVIEFDRQALCTVCKGRGGLAQDMIDCPKCASESEDGTHTSVSSKKYTEFVTTTKKTCPMCKGFGEVPSPGKQCPACNGKRVVNQRARLEMTLPAGAPEGHRHTFPKEGNAAPLRTPGDLVLVFKTNPHTGPGGLEFTRDANDHSALRATVGITLEQALLGVNLTLQTLNGTEFTLNETDVIMVGEERVVPGAGLPVFDPNELEGKKVPRYKKFDLSASPPEPDNSTAGGYDGRGARGPFKAHEDGWEDPYELVTAVGPLIVTYEITFPELDVDISTGSMRSVFQGFDNLYSSADDSPGGDDDELREDEQEDEEDLGNLGEGEENGTEEAAGNEGSAIHTKPKGPFKAERFTAGEL